MKLYVVNTVSCDGYDSWESSYHLTRKGALKMIMQRQYANWEECRYISLGNSYDELRMYITEKEMME
jgi:hypothetical protein